MTISKSLVAASKKPSERDTLATQVKVENVGGIRGVGILIGLRIDSPG